jgi:hypothetical protein
MKTSRNRNLRTLNRMLIAMRRVSMNECKRGARASVIIGAKF